MQMALIFGESLRRAEEGIGQRPAAVLPVPLLLSWALAAARRPGTLLRPAALLPPCSNRYGLGLPPWPRFCTRFQVLTLYCSGRSSALATLPLCSPCSACGRCQQPDSQSTWTIPVPVPIPHPTF